MYYIPDCNDNNESSRLVNITQVKRNNSEVLYGGPLETAQTCLVISNTKLCSTKTATVQNNQ